MLFFYIRHGDPIYNPDSLTALGHRQAEALAKRLSLFGMDKLFASTSNRAIETAQPTSEITKKEITLLDFAHEKYAARDMTIPNESGNGRHWLFFDGEMRRLFCEPSIRELGFAWYDHPTLSQYPTLKTGMERVYRETDALMLSLGYEHIRYTGSYRVVTPSDERVALFAHQGFGMSFLSCLLDIPYPQFCLHFDLCHTAMTVIEFREENGIAIPCVLTYASDSHLYREGLPTYYNHRVRF